MALPNNSKMKWPPEEHHEIYESYEEYDAWYSGDPLRLATIYSGRIYPVGTNASRFFSDVMRNTFNPKGKFWGKQLYEERRTMVHVPIAGSLAGTSAELLFSEAPKVRIPEAQNGEPDGMATQERLDEIIVRSDIMNRLLDAAESCAALGGVFLKPIWDSEVSDFPILTVAQADSAVPIFQYGILRSCTFWKILEREEYKNGEIVWRLLENHERGRIEYGLYKGNDEELGMRVGLAVRPETANLPDSINTGIDDILVRYVPNVRPNRRFRGSSFGQSDFSGLEGLMDSLDEVYSSWMRDIRLGQGRLLVPESFLAKNPDGTFSFDVDKEIYSTLDIDPLNASNIGITAQQFEIRTSQHLETCLDLVSRIVSSAGYSPQTFGLSISGQSESGTALNLRERKSFITKSKKERFWKSALEDVLFLMLQIDKIHFGRPIELYRPIVEFQDTLANDQMQTSAAVESLVRAQAVSIETKVKMVHPDWTHEQIEAEVERIKEENGIAMPSISMSSATIRQEAGNPEEDSAEDDIEDEDSEDMKALEIDGLA